MIIGSHDATGFYLQIAPTWKGPYRRIPLVGYLFTEHYNANDNVTSTSSAWQLATKSSRRRHTVAETRLMINSCKKGCSFSGLAFVRLPSTRAADGVVVPRSGLRLRGDPPLVRPPELLLEAGVRAPVLR